MYSLLVFSAGRQHLSALLQDNIWLSFQTLAAEIDIIEPSTPLTSQKPILSCPAKRTWSRARTGGIEVRLQLVSPAPRLLPP